MSTWRSDIRCLGLRRYIWARFFYRHVMRFAHRFDWHYAPEHGPFEDGRYQRWCQWCGMRYSYTKWLPGELLRPIGDAYPADGGSEMAARSQSGVSQKGISPAAPRSGERKERE